MTTSNPSNDAEPLVVECIQHGEFEVESLAEVCPKCHRAFLAVFGLEGY